LSAFARFVRRPIQRANAANSALQSFHHAAALDYIGFDPCHVVQFYETERFLAGAVIDFLAAGLAAGQSGVAIATAAHREAFVTGLRRRDIDVDRVIATAASR
jgi:MEDS: MEthanogen/methylotroph, DcmR Sensory domain